MSRVHSPASALAQLRCDARAARRALTFGGATLALLPTYMFTRALQLRGTASSHAAEAHRGLWVRRWARALVANFGLDIVHNCVHSARNANGAPFAAPAVAGAGRLIVSNHRSAMDIGVLLTQFPGYFVSRADLADWPLIGKAAREVGTVFVDRASRKSGATVTQAIETHLRAGHDVLLFPEGTTFEGDLVRTFRRGAFGAAARANAQVLPVGLAYAQGSQAAFTQGSFATHIRAAAAVPRTRVAMIVGAQLGADGDGDLAERAQSHVQKLVDAARMRVDS
jgi:lyso-ornithine lipid O-acyltransferase